MADELAEWKAEAIWPCRLRRGERGRLGCTGLRLADGSSLYCTVLLTKRGDETVPTPFLDSPEN
jgi:hypothetical protein